MNSLELAGLKNEGGLTVQVRVVNDRVTTTIIPQMSPGRGVKSKVPAWGFFRWLEGKLTL